MNKYNMLLFFCDVRKMKAIDRSLAADKTISRHTGSGIVVYAYNVKNYFSCCQL